MRPLLGRVHSLEELHSHRIHRIAQERLLMISCTPIHYGVDFASVGLASDVLQLDFNLKGFYSPDQT